MVRWFFPIYEEAWGDDEDPLKRYKSWAVGVGTSFMNMLL